MHQKNLTIKKIFNLALQTHQKNNFKVAENLYNKILKIDPNNFQTIFLLGTLSTQTLLQNIYILFILVIMLF